MMPSLSIPGSSAAGAVSYIERLRAIHLSAKSPEFFIPLSGKMRSLLGQDFAVDVEVEKFLASSKKVLLLSGNAGSGKSVYCQQQVRKLWQEYSSDKPIPIYLSLASIKDTLDNLLNGWLSEQGLSAEEISQLQQTNAVVLFLDGYDELHQLKNLYLTNNLSKWRCKVIITCRSEYLYQVQNYPMYFMPYEGEMPQLRLFDEIKITGLKQEQISSYLQHYVETKKVAWDWQTYQGWFARIAHLNELASIPFFLKIVVEKLPSIAAEGEADLQVVQKKLYDVCIQAWFIRQEAKLKANGLIAQSDDIKPEFWAYAKRLVQAMQAQRVTQIEYQEGSDLFEEAQSPWQAFLDESKPRIALLKTTSLLHEISPNCYAFLDHSLIEYFATQSLDESLPPRAISAAVAPEEGAVSVAAVAAATPTPLPVIPREWLVDYFNQHLFTQETDTLRFLADSVEEDGAFKESLFARIEASKSTEEIKTAAANAITALNVARVDFSGLDLRDVQISGADLSHALCEGTDFSNANLRDVSFANAQLRQANWNGADCFGLFFDEHAYIKQLYLIVKVLFYTNTLGKFYWLTACKDGNVHQYDSQTHELYRTYTRQFDFRPPYSDLHTDVAISNTIEHYGSYLAVSGESLISLWSMEKGELAQTIGPHMAFTTCVSFSPCGLFLAVGFTAGGNENTENVIRLWRIENGLAIKCQKLAAYEEMIEGKEYVGVYKVIFSPDGTWLVSGSYDGILRLWRFEKGVATKKVVLQDHSTMITDLSFSPSGKCLSSSSSEDLHLRWVGDGTFTTTDLLKLDFRDSGIFLFASTGEWLIWLRYRNNPIIQLWALDNGLAANIERILECENSKDTVVTTILSPDGEWLACGTYSKLSVHRARRISAVNIRAHHFVPLDLRGLNITQTIGLSAVAKRLCEQNGAVGETAPFSQLEEEKIFKAQKKQHSSQDEKIKNFMPDLFSKHVENLISNAHAAALAYEQFMEGERAGDENSTHSAAQGVKVPVLPSREAYAVASREQDPVRSAAAATEPPKSDSIGYRVTHGVQ